MNFFLSSYCDRKSERTREGRASILKESFQVFREDGTLMS